VSWMDVTRCTLLLVDDEPANLDLLEDLLGRAGFGSLVRTADAREAVPLFRRTRPDLVLLDLHMPHRSGFEVLADLRALTPPDELLPVLVLTADATFPARQQALGGGASDFLTKPFHTDEVLLRVRNLLRMRLLYGAERRARDLAELLSEASRTLAASLDGATAAVGLANLLVPRFADACAVDLEGDAGPLRAASVGSGDFPEGAWTLAAPLRGSARTLGRLVVGRAEGRPLFAPEEAVLVEELGRRAGAALESARLLADTRAAVEARQRVLAIVAHDLRGPLTAIRLDAEVLGDRLPEAEGGSARTARRIARAAGRMDGLIEDLLEVARVEGGAYALEPADVDLNALLREAGEMLRPLAAAHALALSITEAAGEPLVRADGKRLLQAVTNLVGNAVKFTPAGGAVSLAARVDGTEARISVCDTGPGIPPEELPHVFGAFWQARHADRRGLGLGLSIARGIAEAHGGRIWVESAPGQGAAFHVTLPLSGAADHQASPPT
jgi:signal transduction histidine kinase/DNA-binding NarL/FixJ family response regulator